MKPVIPIIFGRSLWQELLRTLRHASQSLQLAKPLEMSRVGVTAGAKSGDGGFLVRVERGAAAAPAKGTRDARGIRSQAPREGFPTRWQAARFVAKTWVFRVRRWLRDANDVARPLKLARRPRHADWSRAAESRASLYSSQNAPELALQAGKIQNLRIAAQFLDGLVFSPGKIFSFWANVPRPTRRRGFTLGRELREGCVIPSVGGGLCQLSNALYDAALQAGLEIVERHAHSRRLSGSMAAVGRDATVFWNYVDLRFRSRIPMQLELTLLADELVVRFLSSMKIEQTASAMESADIDGSRPAAASCETCGVASCFRHPAAESLTV